MESPLHALLAALPMLVILLLMAGFRWTAARAGAAGLAVTLAVALGPFDYGRVVYGEIGRARAIAGPLAEAVFTTATIIWIIFPALAIYHLQQFTGGMQVLQQSIARLAQDRRIIALLVAWFFALFLEGAAGFGTPIALAAPFLVSAGFKPAEAVAIALLGHAAGVSFGAVGTPVVPQAAMTGIAPIDIARATGVYAALVWWVMPPIVVALVTRGLPPEDSQHRSVWPWAILAAGLFLAPQFAVARWIGPELPTLGGALLGGLVFALLWQAAHPRRQDAANGAATGRAIAASAAPYLLVISLVLVTRLVDPIRDLFGSVVWEWTALERFGGSFQPLYHPGSVLIAALLLGALVQRARIRDLVRALRHAGRQVVPVSIALVTMLALSRLLVHAGMIDALAAAAAAGAGRAWPLFTPVAGVLGTFVTGSATSSNILFTELQAAAARQNGMPVVGALGAQGFGAAAGNMIAPHNVLAGAAAVGAVGREGDILRLTLAPCVAITVLGGLVAWLVFGS